MGVTKVLARGFKFEVQVSAQDGGTEWEEIKGINTFTWANSKSSANTTSFDENGRQSHLPASRGATLTLEGFYLEDPDTGERDPGQKAVEDLAKLVGPEGLGTFRITSPGGKVKEFQASANIGGVGGGTDDPASWSVELEISGEIVEDPMP